MPLGVWIILLVLLVIFIPVAAVLITKAGQESKLNQEGVLIEGRITKHRSVTYRGTDTYYLTYSYTYNGATYSHEELVNDDLYRLGDGATFPVRCLPQQPHIAKLDF